MEQKPKGTYDLLPKQTNKYRKVETMLINLLQNYGYEEIRTPIFEHSSVFHRESELSDMVIKQTYDFTDKAGRSLTLRPEGTAGVIRSYVENKLYHEAPVVKLFYLGPNFRYERPQKLRYRQFYQIGVEAIGTKSASLDAEMVALSYKMMTTLGLRQVKIKINTLGDITSRTNYKEALKAYFTPYKEQLCPDCQKRLTTNPIRILDCKVDANKEFMRSAPKPIEHLTEEAYDYFNEVLAYLDDMDVIYEIDHMLVRGLDYYGHIVFEVLASIKGFGAQNALGGGGHYEQLVSELGGPNYPGVGVAFGMERLMFAVESENIDLDAMKRSDFEIIYFDKPAKKKALSLITLLRDLGLKGDLDHLDRPFKNQLKQAVNKNPKFIIIIGEDELKDEYFTVKELDTQKQEKLNYEELVKRLGC